MNIGTAVYVQAEVCTYIRGVVGGRSLGATYVRMYVYRVVVARIYVPSVGEGGGQVHRGGT